METQDFLGWMDQVLKKDIPAIWHISVKDKKSLLSTEYKFLTCVICWAVCKKLFFSQIYLSK